MPEQPEQRSICCKIDQVMFPADFIQKQKYQQQKLFILNYMLVENLVEIVDIKYLEDFMVLVHLLLMLFTLGWVLGCGRGV